MAQSLEPGTSLRAGRYVIVRSLGSGSQGATYEAADKREGRAVAIKRFDVRGARAWKDVELAEREARVLAGLSHPKLPAYVEHFEENGELYLVMEKIDGTPLSDLAKRGGLDEADVIRLLRDADEVLRYLHSRAPPVIHRDLKPGNVIQRPDGSFAFVDFGAVRDRMRPEGGSTVVGTFGYMAPEQFQGRASPGSDVYSIGATALSLLTGVQPEALPHKGLAIDVDAALRGRANHRLREVLERMLEPDPDKRPQAIGPLLTGLGAPRTRVDQPASGRRSSGRSSGVDWTRVAEEGARIGREIEDKLRRETERAVERAQRRSRRAERRDARRGDRGPEPWSSRNADRAAENALLRAEPWRAWQRVPWPIRLIFSLAMTFAQVVVWIALRILVPTLLRFLSLFFGRGLVRASEAVSGIAGETVGAMSRASRIVQGYPPRAGAPAIRVAEQPAAPPAKVRLSDPEAEVERAAMIEESEDWERRLEEEKKRDRK